MISVVIPLYNKEKTVERALRSVLGQTFQVFEIIIVDDGSTDGSVTEVKKFTDPRIRLVHQANAGVSAARNRGIQEAQGELIAFLDADDEWLPEYLTTIDIMRLRYPSSDVLATDYYFQRPDGSRRLPVLRGLKASSSEITLDDYFAVASQSDPPLCSSAVAVRKQALDALGGFPVGIKSGEDLLTWARLAIRFPITIHRKPLSIFHQDPATGDGIPSRRPDPGDRVAKSLHALLAGLPPRKARSLRRYIGMWHKMRAAIYLRLGNRASAVSESFRSLRYRPGDWKVYALMLGCLLPTNIVRHGFVAFRNEALYSPAKVDTL
jgi:hypothetical protein